MMDNHTNYSGKGCAENGSEKDRRNAGSNGVRLGRGINAGPSSGICADGCGSVACSVPSEQGPGELGPDSRDDLYRRCRPRPTTTEVILVANSPIAVNARDAVLLRKWMNA